jgi:mono/diheme cytochrome c family protein
MKSSIFVVACALVMTALEINACTDSNAQTYSDGGDSLRIVSHAENLPVGFPSSSAALELKNPYEGNAQALATGKQLFVAYNCIDCHGADGAGAMGPSFQDGRWHFGGTADAVFESIYQGRPDGMLLRPLTCFRRYQH